MMFVNCKKNSIEDIDVLGVVLINLKNSNNLL